MIIRNIVAICLSVGISSYAFWRGHITYQMSIIMGACCLAFFFGVIVLQRCIYGAKSDGSILKVTQRKEFDWGMHYFRAFAIFCIIMMHFLQAQGHYPLSRALFTNSTIYFLFISGYLCQYLDLRKPTRALVYYKKKLLNVIAPFVFCSLVTCSYVVISRQSRYGVLAPSELADTLDWLKAIVLGRAQSQYWYIPFVSFLFLISPSLLRLKNQKLVLITFCAVIVAMIFPQRGSLFTFSWPTIFCLYAPFVCHYLLGFVYCRYRDCIDTGLQKTFWMNLVLGLVVAVWLKVPNTLELQSTGIWEAANLQKVLFTGVGIVSLSCLKNRRVGILDMIAQYSFTLYFIHMFFCQDFVDLTRFLGGGILADAFSTFLYLVTILLVSWMLKIVFGKWSRIFIGS